MKQTQEAYCSKRRNFDFGTHLALTDYEKAFDKVKKK
jgi:hypothetical protein